MQIVIEISKRDYDLIKWASKGSICYPLSLRVYRAIANGTPLPKRMLSVDLIIETLCPKDEDYDYPCIAPSYLEEELNRLLLDNVKIVESEECK